MNECAKSQVNQISMYKLSLLILLKGIIIYIYITYLQSDDLIE